MSRSLLHRSKLGDFKAWLTAKGIEHRPGRGDFQVLQVLSKDKKNWFPIYDRLHEPEHLTNIRYLDPLVKRFCRENRNDQS